MSDWLSHPLTFLGGVIFAVLIERFRKAKPWRFDVTIHHPKEDDHDPDS